jgi:general secretion pathway protein A
VDGVYKEYFRLTDLPFSIAPDPTYLYMSEKHREALAHLIYGVNSEGAFVLLTGEVGTGKTTICRCMLDQLPQNCDIAFILNPRLTELELLATICEEIGIDRLDGTTSIKGFVDRINRHLLDSHAAGRKTLLIIDEAQNLTSSVLEQLRLLTNLETNRCKLLQIVLIGQPELRDMLARRELRQLSQRDRKSVV